MPDTVKIAQKYGFEWECNVIWEKNNATKFWNEQLHSFSWIKDVRAVGTNKARIFLAFYTKHVYDASN